MDPQLLPFALLAIVVAGFAAVIVFIIRRRSGALLEKLGPAFELGTSRPARPFGAGVEGLYQGYFSRYTVQQASQYDRGGAMLRVNATSSQKWSAQRSQPGTGLLVTLGVLKDVEVGDAQLDRHFRFTADDSEALRGLFRLDRVREAVLRFANTANAESVSVREDRVDLKWSPRSAELDEDPEVLRDRLTVAIELTTATGAPPRLAAPR
jgi:hypothetical protein